MGMVIMTCCDVVSRMFGYPIFGAEEIVTFLVTLVIGLSLPFAHQEKIHVGVEIVVRLLPESTQRKIKFGTDLASLALMITITIMMFYFGYSTQSSGEVSMNLEFPEYMVIYGLAVCFFIWDFYILKDIILFFQKEKGDV